VLLRGAKRKVKDIARELNVSVDAVERWLRRYRRGRRRPQGEEAHREASEAEEGDHEEDEELLRQDPQAFGYLKGRWVVRDIAKALSQEGVTVSRSYVQEMLRRLGLSYKRPKLDVKSNDPNYYRKAREVRRYKQAAAMLAKRGSWSHSRMRPGPRFTPALKPCG